MPGLEILAGGIGCTLESCTYRDRLDEFDALGAAVVGVSTQRPDEQREFARHNKIQFPLGDPAGVAPDYRRDRFGGGGAGCGAIAGG